MGGEWIPSTNRGFSLNELSKGIGFILYVHDGGTTGYGYKYNFKNALSEDGTIVLPPNTGTPSVFELKNPNQNIQGRVR